MSKHSQHYFDLNPQTREKNPPDWETIARRFDPSHQLITAHTSHGDPYHVVRVSARKGGK